jgi:hypothetical protein
VERARKPIWYLGEDDDNAEGKYVTSYTFGVNSSVPVVFSLEHLRLQSLFVGMHEYGLKTYCHNHVCTKRMCTAHSDKKVLNTKVKLINKTADCYSPKFHLLEIDRKFLVLECGAWLVIVPPEHPKGHQ